MKNPSKILVTIVLALMCIVCTSVAAGAVENEILKVTGTAVDGGFEVKLDNLCENYIGNVTVNIKNPEGVTDENEMYGFVGGDDNGSAWVRAVAPGESMVLTAKKGAFVGDATDSVGSVEESITDITVTGTGVAAVNDSGDVTPVGVWVLLGVLAVVAAVLVAVFLRKKGVGKSAMNMIVLCALMLGLGSVTFAAEENAAGKLDEIVTIDGVDYGITVEYTVVPVLEAEPLKNIRKPHMTEECNTPQVDERRIKEGAGPLASANVYVGKNDFMFEGVDIDDYIGKTVMREMRLKKLSNMMNERDAWAKENGIKLYFVIAPNKSSVYPDYVPDKITPAEVTNADALVSYLAENSTIEVVDLRQSLVDARAEYGDNLFYKHDTHWNNNGGFVGYSEVMRRIGEDVPGVYTLTKDDYNITEGETYMKDLAWYLGFYSKYTDFGPVYTLKNGLTATLSGRDEYDSHGQFLYCSRWKDGYSDSLKYVTYENVYNADAPSLYMYRDSFSVSMLHFFKDSFNKSVFDWSYEFDKGEILASGADVVIMEVVEKNLVDFSNTRTFADN